MRRFGEDEFVFDSTTIHQATSSRQTAPDLLSDSCHAWNLCVTRESFKVQSRPTETGYEGSSNLRKAISAVLLKN